MTEQTTSWPAICDGGRRFESCRARQITPHFRHSNLLTPLTTAGISALVTAEQKANARWQGSLHFRRWTMAMCDACRRSATFEWPLATPSDPSRYLLDVPFETYRPLDSDRRPVPPALLQRAERVLDQHRRATELVALDALADEFTIHPRTLRAAARDGRLRVQFSTRSVFGRPIRFASRAAIDEFVPPLPPTIQPLRHTAAATTCDGRALELCLATDRAAATIPPHASGTRASDRCGQQVGHPSMGNTQAHTVGRLLDSPEATRAGVIVNSEFAQGWRHNSETTYAATRRIAESRPPLST